MADTRLSRPLRGGLALAFCVAALYGIGGRLLPWALAHLPLAAPLALVLIVGLLAIGWATLDVVRGRL